MATNPQVFREKAKLWRQKNQPKIRASILKRYGLSLADYDQLLDAQGGVCAICSSRDSGYKTGVFFVDHDHVTGATRGLLCSLCNITLGQFRDDPQRFRAAADYLETYPTRRKAS